MWGLKFEREDGYFLGAMYISYALGIGTITVLAALVWEVLNWPLTKSVVGGIVLCLPLAPVLTWMVRVPCNPSIWKRGSILTGVELFSLLVGCASGR